jgi:hypothetical protein
MMAEESPKSSTAHALRGAEVEFRVEETIEELASSADVELCEN